MQGGCIVHAVCSYRHGEGGRPCPGMQAVGTGSGGDDPWPHSPSSGLLLMSSLSASSSSESSSPTADTGMMVAPKRAAMRTNSDLGDGGKEGPGRGGVGTGRMGRPDRYKAVIQPRATEAWQLCMASLPQKPRRCPPLRPEELVLLVATLEALPHATGVQ